jgi:hypothetical protein
MRKTTTLISTRKILETYRTRVCAPKEPTRKRKRLHLFRPSQLSSHQYRQRPLTDSSIGSDHWQILFHQFQGRATSDDERIQLHPYGALVVALRRYNTPSATVHLRTIAASTLPISADILSFQTGVDETMESSTARYAPRERKDSLRPMWGVGGWGRMLWGLRARRGTCDGISGKGNQLFHFAYAKQQARWERGRWGGGGQAHPTAGCGMPRQPPRGEAQPFFYWPPQRTKKT